MKEKQLEYIILLAKERSFSEAAKKLNISQPAFSKQILSLEKELGLPLFDRSSVPPDLTPAGRHFVDVATDLLRKENQLVNSMEYFKSGKFGVLTISVSAFRAQYLMPDVIRKFREKYNGIQVAMHEVSTDALRQEVADGKCDFAIANLPVDELIFNSIPLKSEVITLAVPTALAAGIKSTGSGRYYPKINLSDCEKIPFAALRDGQEMRILFDKFCSAADFIPNISVVSDGISTAWAMVNAGIAASIFPLQFTESKGASDNIQLFELENIDYVRHPAIITRAGQPLSEYAKYMIELLRQK